MGFDSVGLSGGVFQNAYLIRETIKALKKNRHKATLSHKCPEQ